MCNIFCRPWIFLKLLKCSGLVSVLEEGHWMHWEGSEESYEIGSGFQTQVIWGAFGIAGNYNAEKRRVRGDLIQTFRILNGFENVDREEFFELDSNGGYSLRGHDLKLKVHRSKLQLRQSFFSQRVVNTWNRLPASVVQAPSVNNLKKRLDDWSTSTIE